MKTHTKTLLSTIAIAGFAAGSAQAEIIAEYTFATDTSATTEAINTSSDDFAAVGANFGSSGRSSFNSGSYFTRDGDTVFDVDSGYVGFTVTIDPGFELDLTNFGFNYDVQKAGSGQPDFTTTFSVRTSVDSFATDVSGTYTTNPIGNAGNTVDLSETASFDLNGAAFQNLTGTFEVRIYGILSASNFEYINRYDTVLLEGDVAVIPEPGSLALLGLGGLLIARRRRG